MAEKNNGMKSYNPTTPTLRHTHLVARVGMKKNRPLKSLLKKVKSHSGRNVRGVITVRHQGGGVKRMYRIIDFKMDKYDVPAKVVSIEYDPYRSSNIALLSYADGEKRYIISPEGLFVGDTVISGDNVEARVGNSMPLSSIPVGSQIYNIEITRGKGGALVRSAGNLAKLQSIDGKLALIKLPSGEIRYIEARNYATVGRVGNAEWANRKLGKAGRSRHLGIRPSVRGMAMHAEQHPHGGGEGKGQVGRIGKDIWGNRRGTLTRNNKRTNKYIVTRRKGKKGYRKNG